MTSLWEATARAFPRRGSLDGDLACDVVIVGAGYTGLWTAYSLLTRRPDLDVVVVEAEHVGFGASGRNGGWATADVSLDRRKMADRHGRAAVRAMLEAMHDTVDEIGRVVDAEGIDCGYRKGGTFTFATTPAQVPRVRAMIEHEHEWGFGEEDYRWLTADEVAEHVRLRSCFGALATPHCAVVQPFDLAQGLAAAVERRGGRIFEGTRADEIGPGVVRTPFGRITADVVIRATEAYTAETDPREMVPLYSLMVATEPIPDATWDEIGLAGRQTFHDGRHLVIYGQRTEDGRFAFGGRGAPYHFGSGISSDYDLHASTHAAVEEMLRDLFPQLDGVAVSHRWGGAVALPRDWQASVRFDPEIRMGSAGGYVGVGVAASNLAGRTLADLVLGAETQLVRLPWVNHRSRRWEPEPLRWVGINLGRALAPLADTIEDRTGRPSRLVGGLFELLTGHG